MSRKTYEEYGKYFIKTLHYWPKGEIYVCSEDLLPQEIEKEIPSDFKCTFIDLRLNADAIYMERCLGDTFPVFRGMVPRDIPSDGKVELVYHYGHDVCKFHKKAMSQLIAAYEWEGLLVWLDADIKAFNPIHEQQIIEHVGNHFIAHMGRKNHHSCTSYVVWNCGHSDHNKFWPLYRLVYISGSFMGCRQWDDCTILDSLLPRFDAINITPFGERGDNVFDWVFAGQAIHFKGSKRKEWIGMDDQNKIMDKFRHYALTKNEGKL